MKENSLKWQSPSWFSALNFHASQPNVAEQ